EDARRPLQRRRRGMEIRRARLYEAERERGAREAAANRSAQIGTGERSEKSRTYNFPQDRVTDHRVGLTVHDLNRVLAGDLGHFSDALAADERRRQLAAAAGG